MTYYYGLVDRLLGWLQNAITLYLSRVQRKQRLLAKGWFTGEAKEVFIF